jgi:clan AA aspartic protease
MITGQVTPDNQAAVYLRVVGPGGQGSSEDVEFIIDTGFDGHMLLPTSLIVHLQLAFIDYVEYVQGDGAPRLFDLYAASVEWDDTLLNDVPVLATSGTAALIGMALLRGYNLSLDVLDGGPVRLTRLP